MIIDDSGIDAFINQKIIQNHGFAERIYTHNSGVSALEFFKNFEKLANVPSSLLPNVIFLDLNMPNLDGFGFAESLMQLNETITKDIKIVFLSSSNTTEDIDKASTFEKSIAYLVKPLTLEHLNEIQTKLDSL